VKKLFEYLFSWNFALVLGFIGGYAFGYIVRDSMDMLMYRGYAISWAFGFIGVGLVFLINITYNLIQGMARKE
jgi:hypothetical protein